MTLRTIGIVLCAGALAEEPTPQLIDVLLGISFQHPVARVYGSRRFKAVAAGAHQRLHPVREGP